MDIPKTHYARSGGLHIGYQVVGDAPIDLLYTGGFLLSFESYWEDPAYSRFVHRLASFSRLIMFDRRGTGVSDPVGLQDPPTLEQWADDAMSVLDEVGSTRTALFGFGGIGGPVSILFAASHPDRASALVLVNSVAEGGGLRSALAADRDIQPDVLDSEQALERMRAEWGDPDRDLSRMAPSAAGDQRFRNWLAKAYRQGASPAMAVEVGRVMRDTDVRAVLPTVSVPTLVMHKKRSGLPGQSAYLAEGIPNARFVELEGTDHFVWTEDFGPMLDEIQEFVTGIKPEPEIDRVFATLLFTDIVASTERTAEVGDRRWREILDDHDRLVRTQLDRFKGRWVNPTGDGLLASFDGPARAVRCAQAIAESLGPHGIGIRAGIHAGEVELRGEDVTGIAVNIARRVCDSGGPGDVLVSRTVTDLVAGSGLTFEERGEHDLKGVPGRWHLYAVR